MSLKAAVRLERELTRIASRAQMVVGATFRHLESGSEASINGSESFPMASTLKLPLAIHIIAMVEEGSLRLDEVVTLENSDIHTPSWGPVETFFRPGSVLMIRDLLALMLMASDNNATDVLYRIGGGTSAVKGRMRSFGMEDINNDRPTHVMIANLFGHADITESSPMSPEEFLRVIPDTVSTDWASWKGNEAQAELRRRENSDARDIATPMQMVELIDRLWQGKLLKPTGSQLLFDIMYRCLSETGRLKGLLPPGTPVAHKPGEMLFSESDVGIIDLPHGAGHVAAAVYTKDSYETAAKQTELIAHLARAAFDYFTFTAISGFE